MANFSGMLTFCVRTEGRPDVKSEEYFESWGTERKTCTCHVGGMIRVFGVCDHWEYFRGLNSYMTCIVFV